LEETTRKLRVKKKAKERKHIPLKFYERPTWGGIDVIDECLHIKTKKKEFYAQNLWVRSQRSVLYLYKLHKTKKSLT